MTFVIVVLLGVGILFVTSALEDVSISKTLTDILSGQLTAPATPAKEAASPTVEPTKTATQPGTTQGKAK